MKDYYIRLRIDKNSHDILQQVAREKDTNMSEIVRDLINTNIFPKNIDIILKDKKTKLGDNFTNPEYLKKERAFIMLQIDALNKLQKDTKTYDLTKIAGRLGSYLNRISYYETQNIKQVKFDDKKSI